MELSFSRNPHLGIFWCRALLHKRRVFSTIDCHFQLLSSVPNELGSWLLIRVVSYVGGGTVPSYPAPSRCQGRDPRCSLKDRTWISPTAHQALCLQRDAGGKGRGCSRHSGCSPSKLVRRENQTVHCYICSMGCSHSTVWPSVRRCVLGQRNRAWHGSEPQFSFPFVSVLSSEKCPYYMNASRSGRYKVWTYTTSPQAKFCLTCFPQDLFSWACTVTLFVLVFFFSFEFQCLLKGHKLSRSLLIPKYALHMQATWFILSHSHPCGLLTFSTSGEQKILLS